MNREDFLEEAFRLVPDHSMVLGDSGVYYASGEVGQYTHSCAIFPPEHAELPNSIRFYIDAPTLPELLSKLKARLASDAQ